ncbi:MAG: hypothetical protein ACK5RY_12335 [Dolichospermum sp.]|jgi:hypothetical protein|nr:hypothetical protein [Anabaena sp. 49628_E55]
MERLYHGNISTTETSLSCYAAKFDNHNLLELCGAGILPAIIIQTKCSTAYHRNVSTTGTSLPRKHLYHRNISTTVNLTFWDAPSIVFGIFLKIDNINNRGVMGFDGDELDRKTRTITSFISGN